MGGIAPCWRVGHQPLPARTLQLTPQASGSAHPPGEERALMNPTSMVLRWYRQSTGQAQHPQHESYTPEEVLQLLRPTDALDDDSAQTITTDDQTRGEAVRDIAARPAVWLGELTKQQRQEIGALADRLPSLVFHHTIGGGTPPLREGYGGGGGWRHRGGGWGGGGGPSRP